MKRTVEVGVGLFVLFGLLCFAYISTTLGRPIFGARGYRVLARFDSVTGLVKGAAVEVAGVPVGHVERIRLVDYRAEVEMSIQPTLRLQDDAIVSIRTKGIIGETFIKIVPGGSKQLVPPGGVLRQTEDAVDIEQLISTYIHGKI